MNHAVELNEPTLDVAAPNRLSSPYRSEADAAHACLQRCEGALDWPYVQAIAEPWLDAYAGGRHRFGRSRHCCANTRCRALKARRSCVLLKRC